MGKSLDLSGQVFGRLTVFDGPLRDKFGEKTWVCRCTCGNTCTVRSRKLRVGLQKSCGCLRAENIGNRSRTHGESNTPEYRSYRAMLRRCLDPRHRAYPWYGARGIKVCQQWQEDFTTFLRDLGPRPEGYTLDRIDADRDYEPSNCRWASWSVQATNKRRPSYALPLLSM